MGLIVPKHRHNAVARNLVKRRLRELLRLELLPVLHALVPPLDVVVRVSPLAYTRPYEALAVELRQAIARLGRMTFPEPTPAPEQSAAGDES